jgi:ribosomal protein L10
MANPARQNEMETFHVESGNQNFHSLPIETVATPAEIETRRALVGQLLSATSSPAAHEALEKADTLLANARTVAEARLTLSSTSPQ